MELWKKQRRILIAFGIFLAFMFFCTLVSRAVYASKLPQVTAETPRRMALNHTVNAEGIVHQGREYAVTALSGLRVRTVYASVGDHVTGETLLFDLDLEDLRQKIQEKELEIKKLQLQIASMEQNRSLDAQKKQTENDRAQEDYARAEQKTNEALDRAREDLEDARDAYEDHKDSGVQLTPEEDREAAQAAYEEWVEQEESLRLEMNKSKKAYEEAQEEVKRLEAEVSRQQEEQGTSNAEEEISGEPKEPEEGKDSSGQPTDAAGAAADSGERSEEDKISGSDAEDDTSGLSAQLEAAREAEKKAKTAYEEAAAAYESHTAHPVEKPDFSGEDAGQSAWEEKKEALKDAVTTAERAVEDAEQSQSDQLLDAGRKVADNQLPPDADSSLSVSRLELSVLQTELAAYKKVQDASGQVYPEAEGIVTRIQVSPGERVGDGAAVVYADLSSPMQFQVSLTREQKKYVNQGDAVSLKLGSTSVKDLTVDYVAENEMNPELYDARVFLPDQVGTIGQSGSFEVEAQSETFSCCIPLNALYEDASHRTFVYIVSECSGILGTELAAEMVYVKVLDQNDTYAAIEEGVISRETELIVSSTETLEDKAVIRYKE
ncbi:MAG: hypothetical protein HFI16_10745 [Lachnospiraceae bacterium]|nr:hypothetical protein [Lachnospiraceae bacterium]